MKLFALYIVARQSVYISFEYPRNCLPTQRSPSLGVGKISDPNESLLGFALLSRMK